MRLYLHKSEASREMVHRYFDLDGELYFAYTHLVCRTALDGECFRRDLLSSSSVQCKLENCCVVASDCDLLFAPWPKLYLKALMLV